mmetsp:Transcript_86512/g.144421  ORF Transcript_86512/g.144421 Transcript_86512/m.144421 type:complete len:98 (-) Transcript_86512:209-502(-)|eukprot:CAMPEP_0174291342 /NCGR_PEP_ID=MMETSP0809-20121228/31784_1 /TAXON_ID=73025 ORGANISM="Eutreptiella gymnastica-like, Strain CCMP1594" /NCGR_SAMPLE_ID=MMETSP0809 /ASSEMBLY_ACC=CAM_ASM_000658 /LENGTH=97 /DNA_ID=CAMNT_0015390595 /DNA_START=25 /DNA_END=318 /DNA_ORIENTATION=-
MGVVGRVVSEQRDVGVNKRDVGTEWPRDAMQWECRAGDGWVGSSSKGNEGGRSRTLQQKGQQRQQQLQQQHWQATKATNSSSNRQQQQQQHQKAAIH